MAREELYPGVIGMEVKADTSREGVVDDGNVAWEERVYAARQQWTQARPEDFEKVDKRTWRDRATGKPDAWASCHRRPTSIRGNACSRNSGRLAGRSAGARHRHRPTRDDAR
jgi:hypothetical protein